MAVRRPLGRATRHPLIVGAREHFHGLRESDTGYLRPTKRRVVDLFDSRDTLDRALDTANILFLALEDRGHRVGYAPLDQHLRRPAIEEGSKGRSDPYGRGSWGPERATVV